MEVVQRELTARDGTRIGYQVRGQGPCIVLANGLGANHLAFTKLPALERYKTIAWDYRGMFTSALPLDPGANTVVHQVADLVEILALEGVDDFAILGWSMGVQVALEAIRLHRARVRGLFAINGTHGRLFRTVMANPLSSRLVPLVLRLIRAQARLMAKGTKFVTTRDHFVASLRAMGIVAPTIDVELFGRVLKNFGDVDWKIYADLLHRLDEHDAHDVLATIDVPVTIVTGDRDLITPAVTAHYLHERIAGSRLVLLPGGTHYTPMEFPTAISNELTAWLARIPGWAPS